MVALRIYEPDEEREPLTKRQREVLRSLIDWYVRHGQAATFRDLCAELGIDSPNGVHCHVRALRKKGYLPALRDRRARALIPVDLLPVLQRAASEYLDGVF